MAIEYRNHDTGPGGPIIVMTACPICGHEFEPAENRCQHFLTEHSPDDLGLGGVG